MSQRRRLCRRTVEGFPLYVVLRARLTKDSSSRTPLKMLAKLCTLYTPCLSFVSGLASLLWWNLRCSVRSHRLYHVYASTMYTESLYQEVPGIFELSYLARGHVRDRSVGLDGLQLIKTPVQLLQGLNSHTYVVLVWKESERNGV